MASNRGMSWSSGEGRAASMRSADQPRIAIDGPFSEATAQDHPAWEQWRQSAEIRGCGASPSAVGEGAAGNQLEADGLADRLFDGRAFELVTRRTQIEVHRAGGQVQAVGDLLRCPALGEELQALLLAARQRTNRRAGTQAGKLHDPIMQVVRDEMEIAKMDMPPSVPMVIRLVRGECEERALAVRPSDRQGEAVPADTVALRRGKELPRSR